MTPGARVAAAIGILDAVRAGAAVEAACLRWARGARYAGSKDRAAVRDHVFDAVRRYRSAPARGGGEGGRAWMIGLLRDRGADLAALFDGAGHAPAPLADGEGDAATPGDPLVALDCPPGAAEALRDSLGDGFEPVMRALRDRAPAFVRVSPRRGDVAGAIAALAEEGIEAERHPLSPTALRLGGGARAVGRSRPYLDGRIELQDAASQAVVDALPLEPGMRVLDHCAGGGGKALAMAARAGVTVVAHDADPARMGDLPARAARAGTPIDRLETAALPGRGPFDVVLVDAPCTGSGAWRRSPEGKMRFDPAGLAAMTALQAGILDAASRHVAPGGLLAYATCSLFDAENAGSAAAFVERAPAWRVAWERRWTPLDGADGFYTAHLRRNHGA